MIQVQHSRTREELDAQWNHMEEMTPQTVDEGTSSEEAAARLEFDEAHFEADCMNEVDEDDRVEDNVQLVVDFS